MPTHSRVQLSDASLAVESWGSADAPLALLAAGTSCTRDWWPPELCALLVDQGLRVVRFDQRDTGASTVWPAGSPGYGLDELTDDLVHILDHVKADRAHVVGFSQGGWAAQLLALRRPDRVATLTLIASRPTAHGPADADLPEVSPALLDAWSHTPEPDWGDPASVIEAYVAGERALAGSTFDAARVGDICTAAVARSPQPRSAANHPLMECPRWREELGRIVAPTTVLHGTHDPLFPVENAYALAAEIPSAKLHELDGVGHELPRHVWEILRKVLAGHVTDTDMRNA